MQSTFQKVGSALVVGCIALTTYWVATDSGLYDIIGNVIGKRWDNLSLFATIYLTFLALVLAALALMLAVRWVHGDRDLGLNWRDFPRHFRAEHAKNEKLYVTAPADLTPAMRKRARLLGVAFIGFGITFLIAAAMTLILSLQEGTINILQIMLVIAGFYLCGAGIYQLISGRTVLRKKAVPADIADDQSKSG